MYGQGPGFANPFLPPFTPGYPMAVFGADPATPAAPAAPGALDRFKTALGQQNSIVPVKNGTLLAASAGLGLLLYGSAKGWFGGRKRR
jgi:hypothetical protein